MLRPQLREFIGCLLPDCDPIRSINSHQMIWMAKFVSWLQSDNLVAVII